MPDYGIGFTNLEKESDATRLPVTGEIPKWLAGTLLRNGPALFDTERRSFRHWFDGQAMVHRFAISDGEVTYTNRFLRTEAYRAVRERGRISYVEFATDPCGSIFNRFFTKWRGQPTDNVLVNIASAGDRVLALTETPLPIEFDPETLATVGLVDYGDEHPRSSTTTAHPHVEPATGALMHYS